MESSGGSLTSAGQRYQLNASVLGEVGLIDFLGFGVGGRVSMILSPALTIEAGYLYSQFALFGYSREAALLSARAKWFLGNSFYLTGGAGYRDNTVSERNVEYDDANRVSIPSVRAHTQEAITAELGIGNQWQFSGFTIGCDWVGLSQPVATLSSEVTVDGEPESISLIQDNSSAAKQEEAEKNRREMDTQVGSGSVQLVRFYLGWSF